MTDDRPSIFEPYFPPFLLFVGVLMTLGISVLVDNQMIDAAFNEGAQAAQAAQNHSEERNRQAWECVQRKRGNHVSNMHFTTMFVWDRAELERAGAQAYRACVGA